MPYTARKYNEHLSEIIAPNGEVIVEPTKHDAAEGLACVLNNPSSSGPWVRQGLILRGKNYVITCRDEDEATYLFEHLQKGEPSAP